MDLAAPESAPEETLPEETLPEETLPEETLPEQTLPEETGDALPEATVEAIGDRPAAHAEAPDDQPRSAEADAADDPAADEIDAAPAAASPAAEPAPAAPHHSAPPRPAGGPPMINGRPPQISRASNKDETFAEGDHVVYPTHGVGRVEKIAVEEIAGHKLELIHITFEENRMTLRVPVTKARSAGLRKLATRKLFDEALAVLKGRARIKRTMWSRRAQEYEAKINSGDPLAIAEVVRDLHRNAGQPDQSFSERQIYEAAMDRLAAELAALDQTDKATAATKLANYVKTLV
jgi:CarD family transcriptional regulator